MASYPFAQVSISQPPRANRHINPKAMFALSHTMYLFCSHHPGLLPHAQVLVAVDIHAVVGALSKGWATPRYTLLVDLFHLQARERFWLRLRCLPRQTIVKQTH